MKTNPNVFASLTAGVQLCLIGARLFKRPYGENCKPSGSWEEISLADSVTELSAFEAKRPSRAKHNREQYYFSCLRACLSDDVASFHYAIPRSVELERQLEPLIHAINEAKQFELDDLPNGFSNEETNNTNEN